MTVARRAQVVCAVQLHRAPAEARGLPARAIRVDLAATRAQRAQLTVVVHFLEEQALEGRRAGARLWVAGNTEAVGLIRIHGVARATALSDLVHLPFAGAWRERACAAVVADVVAGFGGDGRLGATDAARAGVIVATREHAGRRAVSAQQRHPVGVARDA